MRQSAIQLGQTIPKQAFAQWGVILVSIGAAVFLFFQVYVPSTVYDAWLASPLMFTCFFIAFSVRPPMKVPLEARFLGAFYAALFLVMGFQIWATPLTQTVFESQSTPLSLLSSNWAAILTLLGLAMFVQHIVLTSTGQKVFAHTGFMILSVLIISLIFVLLIGEVFIRNDNVRRNITGPEC